MLIQAKRSDRRHFVVLAMLTPLLWACGDDPSRPYLEFAGGGFIFNYRTANHYYGFVVRQQRPLPEGAKLKVTFEVPGGKTEMQEEPAVPGRLQYKFQTGDLEGIEPGHAYTATLAVLDKSGKEIALLTKSFRTEVDQSKLPDSPLVKGPGYEPVPQ